VRANGTEIAVVELGSGPLALCLHGFPDSPYTWRYLLPELAAAGYHAVAPFSRGYAPSAVPRDGAYQLGAQIADVEALHDVLDADDRAVLIGHDWGAPVTYGALAHNPDRWARGVGMSVPPGDTLPSGFFEYDQLKQSFYLFLSQTPIAELAFAAGDLAIIEGLWRDWAPCLDAADDMAHAKACMRHPDHLAAVIGYQRAAFNPRHNLPSYASQEAAATRQPQRPVLYLHGELDSRLDSSLVRAAASRLRADAQVRIVPGLGHFLHLERPDEVNRLVLDWLGATRQDAACSTPPAQPGEDNNADP
jgi:pimeloyl-ACP methyl ester carboxylesterase